MKQYMSLFKIRFISGLQYRASAFAGIITQFLWGFMEILTFLAFYQTNSAAFPMKFSHLVSYIWIQQAFLAMFVPWGVNSNLVETIVNGDVAYDLARPLNIYNRWFFEMVADRVAKATLRCIPMLIMAFLLPPPFGMTCPLNLFQFLMFIISAPIAMFVTTSYCLIDSISTFYTMSRHNTIFIILANFFAGGYVPIPFFPESFKTIVELLPFSSMQNMPLRIYSGNIEGFKAIQGIGLQIFWLAILITLGNFFMKKSLKRVISQGG